MDMRGFVILLAKWGLESLPAKFEAFKSTVTGIVAGNAPNGIKMYKFTALDQNASNPDAGALTIDTGSTHSVGVLVRPVTYFFTDRSWDGYPYHYGYRDGSAGTAENFANRPDAGDTSNNLTQAGYHTIVHNPVGYPGIYAQSDGGSLTNAAFQSSGTGSPSGYVHWGGRRSPTSANSEKYRYGAAWIDRSAEVVSVSGCAVTTDGTGVITVSKTGAFPATGGAGTATYRRGDLIVFIGLGTGSFGDTTITNTVYSIDSTVSPDSITLVAPDLPRANGASLSYTGATISKLRGIRFSVNNQDGLPCVHELRYAPIDDADFYNGEQSSIGALLNCDGVNTDFGSGSGLYIYDGTTKSGSVQRGWRRLGDGARAVTCTAGAAVVTTAAGWIRGVKTLMLSAAGSVTVGTATTTPILPDGFDGQSITLLNVGANDIILTDQGTMAASNLRLTASTVTLTGLDSIRLTFSSVVGDWIQTGPLVAPV